MNSYKDSLEKIVHDSLYVNSTLSDDVKNELKVIINQLNDSNDYFSDLRTLISHRTNETTIAYNKYINDILCSCSDDNKLLIISNPEKYEDIIKDENIYINIALSLDEDNIISFLKSKKKFTDLDIKIINGFLVNSKDILNNKLLKIILNDEVFRNKIPAYNIELTYSKDLLNIIPMDNFDVCNVFNKELYTKLLLKYCKNFDDFKKLYLNNKNIFNLICKNGLTFNSNYNKDIYTFILDNPNFIGKFNNKYLDLFSIVEITDISNIKTLDSDAFSSIITKLYKYNNDNANELFDENNLKKCSKNSLDVVPFQKLDDSLRLNIFNTYNLFNRFIDTIMIEAIDSYFEEDDILNILRNDTFVDDMSPYAIELLINKLSFRSAFNMLQRKNILNKVNNLNNNINDKDAFFVKGYLDSPSLVMKSDHSMIYDMLCLLNKDEILYYVTIPYICDVLSNYEIINLCINNNIDINDVINSNVLMENLNTTDLITIINESCNNDFNLNLFNKSLLKILFNLEDNIIKLINFDEVNYLYETIRMKSLLSKQECSFNVNTYKNVLASYLVLGLDDTLKLVNQGNNKITLNDIMALKNDVINERVLRFKENNSFIFHNMYKKVSKNLLDIGYVKDINDLASSIRKNTYLDNIVYLMLDNEYDSYNNIINKFYSYINYYTYDEFNSNKDIYDYCNSFISKFISKKTDDYNNDFTKVIFNNFKPKENIIYSKRKELGKNYLSKLKLKLFIRALTESNKDIYKSFFRTNYDLDNIKSKYISYLKDTEQEFENILEHILIPLSNDRFDKINCLNKIGINMPSNFEQYKKYNNDLKTVSTLNYEMDKIISNYEIENVLSIMNYICYGTSISFKVKSKDMNLFEELRNSVNDLSYEIYIDKSACKFIYKEQLDIYNIDEIVEYMNYLDILDKIIDKTYKYINRNMCSENIKNCYSKQYFEAINTDSYTFPITNKYYEPRKRVFGLNDINRIFDSYDINNYKKTSKSLRSFLLDTNNLIMIADGYYTGVVDNFGVIINEWDSIKELAKQMNVNLETLSIISADNLLTIARFNKNILAKALRKDIVNSIYDTSYYQVLDLNERLGILVDLFEASYKSIKSSIPYIAYNDDSYTIKIIDKYDQDVLYGIKNSIYKVGSLGNDLLHYSILNKDGAQIGIYKNEKLIAKSIAIRNGNTLFLNGLEGIEYKNYINLLKSFANELLKLTIDDEEPINYVTIVNNDCFNDENGFELDVTMCSNIEYPISDMNDYDSYILDNQLFTNYANGMTTLLASNLVVDKNNFKIYDAENKYLRKRNNVVKLSNNIGENYLNRIDAILYLCKKYNDDNIDDIHLNDMDSIYLGDDFVLFYTNDHKIFKYLLPFDIRANNEINLILDSLKDV